MSATQVAGRPWHPLSLLLVLALWLGTVGNIHLWQAIWGLTEVHTLQKFLTSIKLFGIVFAAIIMLLSLTLWPLWRKSWGLILLFIAASSSYFMHTYGIVIDASMLVNAMQTDRHEVRDLLAWPMLAVLLFGVVLPSWWWCKQPMLELPAKSMAIKQLSLGMLATVVMMVLVWGSFQELASTMRNHKSLRYIINPFNTVYAGARLMMGQSKQAHIPLQAIGEDAISTRKTQGSDAAPLIVIIVGETVRAANFGLGGYARDTTPQLKKLQAQGELAYFSKVSSCGTNTQTSVPCMFSHLGRDAFTKNAKPYENLLDVLQRAGLSALWLDNQSGCKGVCDRTTHLETRELKDPQLCPDQECFDEIMLKLLPEQLALLESRRSAQRLERGQSTRDSAGTVVVMHQMGNHGPAYFRRSPQDQKVFQPECKSTVLQECTAQDIVNAYDNAVRYTDTVIHQTVAWLKTQNRPAAIIYLSDHGESLGEKGLYLHGMPYAMAPQEQTHVPMAIWLSSSMQLELGWSNSCWKTKTDQPLSHDNLFHSVLTLAQVKTLMHKKEHDVFSEC